MFLYYGLIFFVFGLVFGSFLNVLIFRHNTGRGISGRSFCPACGRELRWFELLPVVSFISQGGRCRRCQTRISWQYPLVETAVGLLFFLVFWKWFAVGWPLEPGILIPAIYALVASCILVAIFVYDLKHKIIPDGFVYTLIASALVLRLFLTDYQNFLSYPNLADLLAGPLLFLPFFCLWYFSGGKWIGLGDGKLALGLGFWLGFAGGLTAVILGFWLGAAISIGRIFFGWLSKTRLFRRLSLSWRVKNLTMKSEVAFGPFLIAGALLVYFLGFNLIGF